MVETHKKEKKIQQ